MDSQNQPKYYEELSNSGFKQNSCWAWRPRSSSRKTAVIFIVFGILFLVIAFVLFYVNRDAKELTVLYATGNNVQPSTEILFDSEWKAPIHVYYEITNIYQNHRRFTTSVNNDQLYGSYKNDKDAVSSCYPIITNKDRDDAGNDNVTTPCGLLPKFYFNGS